MFRSDYSQFQSEYSSFCMESSTIRSLDKSSCMDRNLSRLVPATNMNIEQETNQKWIFMIKKKKNKKIENNEQFTYIFLMNKNTMFVAFLESFRSLSITGYMETNIRSMW